MSMNICVGQKAPDFSATAVFAEKNLTVKLSGYFNKKYIILFFYPLDLLLFFQSKLLLLYDRFEENGIIIQISGSQ